MSASALPPPIEIPWTMKPVESARTSTEHLPDGRARWSIVHDVLAGVTPEMLVWWFKNIDGDVEVARMEYSFERTTGGTRYHNCLIAGMTAPVLRGPFNALARPRLLSDEMGHAWLTHNVEEVGNPEHFLPALFAARA